VVAVSGDAGRSGAEAPRSRPGRTLRLLIEYDGTGYCGWQRQDTAIARAPSVQATLEAAAREITGEQVEVVGAGRTDAGVHAWGQAAHLVTSSRIPAARFPGALNAHLPWDIRVLEARDMPEGFHARFDGVARTYRYEVLNRPAPTALLRHRAHHVSEPLDLEAMGRALEMLLGRHDFAAYAGAGSAPKTTVCNIREASWRRSGDRIALEITADHFLRHMVRMLVGTLLRVGRGRLAADAPAAFLGDADNARTGPSAPAHGLYLVRVEYRDEPRSP
jgi:tRNA pseudouridine38-40 synthase